MSRWLAQLVERRPYKANVGGSIPSPPTNIWNYMKIGFYGSSACSFITNPHCEKWEYTSYIQMISNHYNATIIHLGQPSASSWDIILLQYEELLKNLPDVAVIIWPGRGFLFHRSCREISINGSIFGSRLHTTRPELWPAVNLYFEQLYDQKKEEIEQLASFKYFDEILAKDIPCKIIHIWEGDILTLKNVDLSSSMFITEFTSPYIWKTGIQLNTNFISLSLANQWPRRPTFKQIMSNDPRCNHIEGDTKNTLISSWIIEAIENYSNGAVLDKIKDTKQFYDDCLLANQTGKLPLY